MQIPVRIVLVETSHPGNVGASARAMKTMGLGELVLVRPRAFPDAEATARASGAGDVLEGARVVDSLAAAVADCGFVVGASARARSVAWPTLGPRAVAGLMREKAATNRVAAVFGPEQSGLTNEDLGLCQRLVTIPTQAGFGSLNLAMAVQVVCYELRMAWIGEGHGADSAGGRGLLAGGGDLPAGDRELPAGGREWPEEATGPAPVPLATAAELEGFQAHLERVLDEVGFLHGDHPRQLKLKLRRIFRRADLDKNEINILRGVLTALDPAGRAAPRSR